MMMIRYHLPNRLVGKSNSHILLHKIAISYSTCVGLPPPLVISPTSSVLPTFLYQNKDRHHHHLYRVSFSVIDVPIKIFCNHIITPQYTLQSSRCNHSSSRGILGSRIPRMSECRSLDEALNATYDNLDILSHRDVAAFWAVVPKFLGGRGGRRQDDKNDNQRMFHQFDKIITKSMEEIKLYDARDMSTLAISLAKIMDKVGKSGNRKTKGSPQQILHDMLIGNNLEFKQFIFDHITCASIPILREFKARDLANFIYAYGLAEHTLKFDDGSTFFDILADQVISFEELDGFKPQHLSNIAWAYATTEESNPKLFKKVAGHIISLDNLDGFKPQELSNIVWAYATARESHPELLKKVADHIITRSLDRFNGQDCSNTVWAYATAKESHPKLFRKVADHVVSLSNLNEFKPQNLSNTVWAFATAGESSPKLFKKVAHHIVSLDNLNDFKPQELSNTAWSYASAGESHPALFQKLSDAAIQRQNEFTEQHVANFLWANATNGQVDKNLFSSLVLAVKANLGKCNEQELANVAWAYSVANVDAPSVFNDEFINACLQKENDFIVENLRQLHQWQLWQKELDSNVRLPSSLQQKCYDAFISRVPEPSKLQDDVISQLSSMDLELEEEVLTKSGYRIDALVEVNGKKIGVEVDGPSHFLGRNRTGSTILKHRQVTNRENIPVVSVPYWEWNKLGKYGKNRDKKEKYIRDLLGLSDQQ